MDAQKVTDRWGQRIMIDPVDDGVLGAPHWYFEIRASPKEGGDIKALCLLDERDLSNLVAAIEKARHA